MTAFADLLYIIQGIRVENRKTADDKKTVGSAVIGEITLVSVLSLIQTKLRKRKGQKFSKIWFDHFSVAPLF